MKRRYFHFRLFYILLAVYIFSSLVRSEDSIANSPVFYVSKLGDNSDGSSWAKAFNTIQAALNIIPDNQGGYKIIIRPDTYFEAMLYPKHSGAKGFYNQLVGDVDGCFGSGTTGRVIIDSGDPKQKGFKSYDWWGPIRSTLKGWSPEHKDSTFSAIGWDRWHLKDLYVTGGDAGIFFDLTDQVKPFSVLVENCVSIGRAFGAGVASCLSRHDEPITFRNCYLWALDEWGDTAGAYVRVENKKMPSLPDILFEDCTIVSPQCALKSSNYGFHTFSHVALKRCRLVVLNFSQPHGTPSNGIIQSVQAGKLLHVDLEDCTLMGYKVFGVLVDKETVKDISYTTKGDVKAYVQFQQSVPPGFHQLPHWPVDVFQSIVPPAPIRHTLPVEEKRLFRRDMAEVTPIEWKGRLCLLECNRPASGGSLEEYYITLKDFKTDKELARFAQGYSLASAFVHNERLYIFASRYENSNWNDVTLFQSDDLVKWSHKIVIKQDANEHLFNSSVCSTPDGFILAYESNDREYPAFTIKFARSDNLEKWTKLPDAVFGINRYTACPTIRFVEGFYYLLYLEHRKPRHYFETFIARSKNLKTWERSSANPVLRPLGLDEGINASDPDIIEWQGKTLLFYGVGDQLTWMNVKYNKYAKSIKNFFQWWFKVPGIPDVGTKESMTNR